MQMHDTANQRLQENGKQFVQMRFHFWENISQSMFYWEWVSNSALYMKASEHTQLLDQSDTFGVHFFS